MKISESVCVRACACDWWIRCAVYASKLSTNCVETNCCDISRCSWWRELCMIQDVQRRRPPTLTAPLSLSRTGACREKRRIVDTGSRCVHGWDNVTAASWSRPPSSPTSVSWHWPSSAAAATPVRLFFYSLRRFHYWQLAVVRSADQSAGSNVRYSGQMSKQLPTTDSCHAVMFTLSDRPSNQSILHWLRGRSASINRILTICHMQHDKVSICHIGIHYITHPLAINLFTLRNSVLKPNQFLQCIDRVL